MVEFRYMHGAVYILENSKAQRVKVGNDLLNMLADRLSAVNDIWLGQKVTCQICGRRLDDTRGYVPQHVIDGNDCLGENALPLEKDVALAETYLENMKNRLSKVSHSEKGNRSQAIKTLGKRIELYRHYNRLVGGWQSVQLSTRIVLNRLNCSHIKF